MAAKLVAIARDLHRVARKSESATPEQRRDIYREVLGLRQTYDFTSEDGGMRYVCLSEPGGGLVLCLVGHKSNPGDEFSELRTGLVPRSRQHPA